MLEKTVAGSVMRTIGRLALGLLLTTASCGAHRITSSPSGASVYVLPRGEDAKPNPEDMIPIEKKTPYVLRAPSEHWYQVQKANYADSEIVYLPSRVWGEEETHHFVLKPLSNTPTDSAAPAKTIAQAVILAVFDIEDVTKQLDEREVLQIREFFETRLTELGNFKIVPREQLRVRLQGKKTDSYRACFDEACQIELGKEVAAEKSLATRILKVGSICVVTSRLFDLKTATSEKAASARVACNSEALLEAINQLAAQLSAP